MRRGRLIGAVLFFNRTKQRFRPFERDTRAYRAGFDPELARALARRGHEVHLELETGSFGRGQMILRLPNGVLVGGTESRTDSNIACW